MRGFDIDAAIVNGVCALYNCRWLDARRRVIPHVDADARGTAAARAPDEVINPR